jgi:quercetin dioxygenase-like cupin family protein
MSYDLPHTIQNPSGEKLTFLQLVKEPGGDKLLVENHVKPGGGPLMHTHYLQEESLTVLHGRIGYQVKGGKPQFAVEGQTVVFAAGVPHKFWNAGNDDLHCSGYVKPANTLMFFLSSIYAAQNKTGSARPEIFDAAYLMTRYATEYEMNDIPWVARKLVMPIIYFIGKLMRKYEHFKNAPQPVKP